MRIIAGLGNPGEKYQNTRHNVGFMAVEEMARQWGARWQYSQKFLAEVADVNGVILVKPQTYMNNSGQAVSKILSFYKMLPDVLTVIHDDIDLPLGAFKIQTNRSAAGHNGVQSIIQHIKTQNFTRVRIGIATPLVRTKVSADQFVLDNFPAAEIKILTKIIPHIVDVI